MDFYLGAALELWSLCARSWTQGSNEWVCDRHSGSGNHRGQSRTTMAAVSDSVRLGQTSLSECRGRVFPCHGAAWTS